MVIEICGLKDLNKETKRRPYVEVLCPSSPDGSESLSGNRSVLSADQESDIAD